MELNIWKNQREIEKTYTADAYDLMYGTIEDIFDILDTVAEDKDEVEVVKAIVEKREALNDLLCDIFPEVTKDELKRTKISELVTLFVELFAYVTETFKKGAAKNR